MRSEETPVAAKLGHLTLTFKVIIFIRVIFHAFSRVETLMVYMQCTCTCNVSSLRSVIFKNQLLT